MVQRHAIADIKQQKYQIIAAFYSNPNWDSEEANRPDQIKKIEASFDKAMELVYAPAGSRDSAEQEIDWDSPFWSAARRAYEAKGIQIDEKELSSIRGDDVDMLEQRRQARREFDQVAR